MKRPVLELSNFSDTFLPGPHSTLHKRIAEGDHRKLPETCLVSRPIFPCQPGLCRPTEYTSAWTPPLLTRPISVLSGNRLLTPERRWRMNVRTGIQLQNLTEPARSTGAPSPTEAHLEVS